MIEKSFASARKFLSVLFAFTLISLSSFAQEISTDAAAIKDGEALFNANCKACHRVKQKLVGPALEHVYDRAPSIQWIKDFVHNSSAVIASGDAYAVKLYNDYGKTQMTAFSGLKDEQIMNILAYIKNQDSIVPKDPGPGPGPGPEKSVDTASSKYLNIILIGMLLILILLVVILSFLISSLRKFLDQKPLSEEDKDIVNPETTTSTILRSRALLFIVLFACAGLGFKAVINGLYSIGIQQGYAPKQPIAFSHKIHAGDMEIDCKYCHTGVLKGKSATIPSTNICMNCHNQIKAGAQTGESQIAQILKSYNENEPIQWVRVHNLPDLAYFNHAQHVNVGGVECQTCHGPVQEMEVVRQHSLLTMGWCIDCHRKTDVNTKGNAYYDKLVELHKQTKGEKAPYKVEDIGGLECSKCHY
jgi:mono/diheme cytochrome c family protein